MAGVRRPREPRKPRAVAVPKVYGRSYKKWMSEEPNITVQRTTAGMLGEDDLEAAAEIIADAAREIAGKWSRRIPPSIKVEVKGQVATISSDAPPAYPNEIEGVRHPVFGMTGGPDDIRLRRAHDPRYRPTRKGSKRGEFKDIPGHWVTNQYRPFLTRALDEKSEPAAARYADKVDVMLRARGFDDR